MMDQNQVSHRNDHEYKTGYRNIEVNIEVNIEEQPKMIKKEDNYIRKQGNRGRVRVNVSETSNDDSNRVV